MSTVASALNAFLLPICLALGLSFAMWIGSWLWRSGERERSRAERIVELAKEELAKEGLAEQVIGSHHPHVEARELPSAAAHAKLRDELKFFSIRRWLNAVPSWLFPPAALALGVLLAFIVGAEFLYVPMVSTSYQKLYNAYCRADAVGQLLSKKVGRTISVVAPKVIDACDDNEDHAPPSTEDRAKLKLDPEDVFFLIDSLGMRETREKSAKDLFDEDLKTLNHGLAVLLVDTHYYYLGLPTSALLVQLAGRLAYGNDVTGRTPTASQQSQATEAKCRTAGLAAVMAQQPFLPGDTHESIGRELLSSSGIRTMHELLFPLKEKNTIDPELLKANCYGYAQLSAFHLGSAFLAAYPGLGRPIISRTSNRLNDGEIVNIALSWSSWPPSKARYEGEPAVLTFMRNISAEASGVSEVRDARIATNFFVGWERLAILIVSVFLVLCLLWQQAMNIIDAHDLGYIIQIKDIAKDDRPLLLASLSILRRMLFRNVGRSAPREILKAALEVDREKRAGASNIDYGLVRRVAEHEMRIADRSRFFFLAGLPLLPTIGFIGTVRSLIEALAIADNIPRARDAVSQVTAVSDVTSTLSLCFSTTFMALTALLIFAPLDLWQATSERRVIEEAERLLDPGI